jgi:hypothetical protein
MFNVCAQRATDPDNLHKIFSPELKSMNERHIAAFINGRELRLWAAWGGLIRKRPYLAEMARCIAALPELGNCGWVSRGGATKEGHPRHPLYVKKSAPLEPFDMAGYVRDIL